MKEVSWCQTPGETGLVLNEYMFLFLPLLNVCGNRVIFLIILLKMYT